MSTAFGHTAHALARQAISSFPARSSSLDYDWGIPLLARLMLPPEPDPASRAEARVAVLAWAAGYRGLISHPGQHGRGLAGYAIGLTHASTVEPRLSSLAELARERLVDWCRTDHQHDELRSVDYDLVGGMAGVVLVLASIPGCRPEHLRPGVRFLLGLVGSPELTRLRNTGREHSQVRRQVPAGVNYGLAHGLPGIIAALVAAYPLLPVVERDDSAKAIRLLAEHLRHASFRDERGVLTWTRASGEPYLPRSCPQAWCYGTPGVAWQLAEAGRILDDASLRSFAHASMTSLCEAWDDDYFLQAEPRAAQFAFCHGAAGMLAITRAFAQHAGLGAAARVAQHLRNVLDRYVPEWCTEKDVNATLFDGVTGALVAMLTDMLPHRIWLLPLGLR